ncbi:YhgE/Pip domain-containing protein [Actinoplanes teichomyceticus]|uniref:Putative membrane protein n=1 Tax=Actinoplanes teichomyceticus TaxID=1867 RepID=A0A561WNA6_ACTTI|nr:YhgE/Pip domain-containing protein [Actinoplanes teichomyceticus]TWG25350.1 putative membrane protein [Actinoplanes teichomyceticus]GIF10418.1 membrane protein [Actinoplanes teichomyceticus]
MTGFSAISLAGLELRRFTRSRLTAAALAVLAVVPLLYGALYLYAFWDPYGHLHHIPAALVVEDRPATDQDGEVVHAGRELADRLIEREVFDWHLVDAKAAEAGLADGRYQIELRIPTDFSSNLVAAPDAAATPENAQLRAVSDDSTNYLSGVFARTAFDEVRAVASADASAKYYDRMLIGFTDLKAETEKAADGAGKIDEGVGRLRSGAVKEASGIDDAHGGAGQLAGKLGQAGRGADRLADGLSDLETGAAQLASGTSEAAAGGRRLATAVDAAADRVEPVLRENAQAIEDAANLVARGADQLAANVGVIGDAADRAVRDARKLRDVLDRLPDGTEGLDEAKRLAGQLVADAERIQRRVDAADLDALRARLREVASTAREVAAAAPHLADDVANARTRVDRLADGLDRLATGAKQLRTGTAQAADGATELRNGVYRLADGARQLDSGLAELSAGGHRIADGLADLRGGTGELADRLADGAGEIPAYDDAAHRSGILADPVSLDRVVRNPAGTYGVGFAPYFLALALWVGAMINYMLLRPLNRRYLASGAPAPRVALAGLLPGVLMGLVQAALLYAVVRFALGLSPVRPGVSVGLLLGTAAVFAAIMQLIGAAFGAPGRIVALVLLMLQLTSSGGTYPVQTTPGFFQMIHPLLPMTYVVEAVRHAVDGGATGPVLHGALVLGGFGLVALLLTVLVAGRKRRMRAADLHPELVL